MSILQQLYLLYDPRSVLEAILQETQFHIWRLAIVADESQYDKLGMIVKKRKKGSSTLRKNIQRVSSSKCQNSSALIIKRLLQYERFDFFELDLGETLVYRLFRVSLMSECYESKASDSRADAV